MIKNWNNLSMHDRANYIRVGVSSGITKLSDIHRAYNTYAKGGYLDWISKIKEWRPGISEDIDAKEPTYDYEGFFMEDPERAWRMLNGDPEVHFTDKYKKPNHPTFSDESIYSTPETPGGHWHENYGNSRRWVYEPSGYTKKNIEETRRYLEGSGEGYLDGLNAVFPQKTIHSGNKFGGGGKVVRYGLTYDPSIKGWRDKKDSVVGGGVRATLTNGKRVHFNTDGTVTDLDSPALVDIRRRLKKTENSKDRKDGGWNKSKKIWEPHSSVEGGEKTIAYGLKLQKDTPNPVKKKWVDKVSKQGYLTDSEAEDMLLDLSLSYMNEAKKTYNKRTGRPESWDELSPKSQSILTDFQYNPGLSKFKNLVNAFDTENMQGINKEYKRYITAGKKKLELTGRNNAIKQDIDSIANGFYTIKRK